jgi:hemerythrin-like domain-containing protein
MIQKLLEDHRHIRMTLDLLEKHYSEMIREGSPDIGLMLSVIVYLQEFTEEVHHPVEDAIFSILLKRDIKSRKLLSSLMTDHTKMEAITRRLRTSLESLKKGEQASKKDLARDIPVLLERLRHHIQVEDESIFPLANQMLSKQDWENIKPMIPAIDDPVFGKTVSNDYTLLYQALDSMKENTLNPSPHY